jgi:hypothetical protein
MDWPNRTRTRKQTINKRQQTINNKQQANNSKQTTTHNNKQTTTNNKQKLSLSSLFMAGIVRWWEGREAQSNRSLAFRPKADDRGPPTQPTCELGPRSPESTEIASRTPRWKHARGPVSLGSARFSGIPAERHPYTTLVTGALPRTSPRKRVRSCWGVESGGKWFPTVSRRPRSCFGGRNHRVI